MSDWLTQLDSKSSKNNETYYRNSDEQTTYCLISNCSFFRSFQRWWTVTGKALLTVHLCKIGAKLSQCWWHTAKQKSSLNCAACSVNDLKMRPMILMLLLSAMCVPVTWRGWFHAGMWFHFLCNSVDCYFLVSPSLHIKQQFIERPSSSFDLVTNRLLNSKFQTSQTCFLIWRTRSKTGKDASPLTLQSLIEKVMVLKKSTENNRSLVTDNTHLAEQLWYVFKLVLL